MNTSNIIILITIIAYLVMMVVIGLVYSKKNTSVGDFYLGGRKLGPIVTAMSAEASDMSSWLLMGLPGVAYLTGGTEAGWTAIGLAVGTYINWLIVAKRLRVYSQHCRAITLPDFFANRYRDKKAIMAIAAIVILVFFVPYTASGFSACGKLFSSLFGWEYHTAMIVSAIIIIAYTCSGGFLAASFTDLIQSIVMTLALICIVIFGIHSAGGFSNVVDNAKEIPGYFSLTEIHNTSSGGSDSYSFLTIASLLAWGLGYFGMPHILLRFMAIEKKEKIKTSRRIASVWVVISMAVAIFIGFIGSTMTPIRLKADDAAVAKTIAVAQELNMDAAEAYDLMQMSDDDIAAEVAAICKGDPTKVPDIMKTMLIESRDKAKELYDSPDLSYDTAAVRAVMDSDAAPADKFSEDVNAVWDKMGTLTGNNSETIIIRIAQFMSENYVILAIIAGLVFAGILACTMSTSDSQLLAASSSMSENVLKGVLGIKMSEKVSMLCARAVLVIIAVLGVVLAWDQDSSVFRIVSFAWAGFGATFGPTMLLALFWKRSNKWGAIAGMISGAAMVFLWKYGIAANVADDSIFKIYELLPAFIFGLIVNVVVSLATEAPEKEIVAEFEEVKTNLNA